MKINLIDVPNRKTPYKKRTGIFHNGDDNLYPTLVEGLINSSTTASSCASVVASFIECNGFTFENNAKKNARASRQLFDKKPFIINKKGETPNVLLSKVAKSLSYQRGVFLHVNYNALYQKTSVQVVPFKNCRLGKEDSEGYKGKIAVYNNWDGEKGRFNEKEIDLIDVYNPDPRFIQAQVEKAGGWDKYKGQVYFLNLDNNDTYPTAFINSVMLDCESEFRSSEFSNVNFKRGFVGKYMLFTKPFEDDEEREEFVNQLKEGTGANTETSIIHYEMDFESEEFKKEYFLEKIDTNTNDKLFDYTDTKIANNIRKAFGNVPVVLIDEVAGKLGNTSGESFLQAQTFMQRQTEKIRNEVEMVFEELFNNFHKPIGDSGIFEIEKLIKDEITNTQI